LTKVDQNGRKQHLPSSIFVLSSLRLFVGRQIKASTPAFWNEEFAHQVAYTSIFAKIPAKVIGSEDDFPFSRFPQSDELPSSFWMTSFCQ
jgi:hypothetical protein